MQNERYKNLRASHTGITTGDYLLDFVIEDIGCDSDLRDCLMNGINSTSIPTMSNTRWTSRVKCLSAFVSNYSLIHEVLQHIHEHDATSSRDAFSFISSMESFELIVACVLVQNILSYTYILSLQLQKADTDLMKCFEEVQEVKNLLINKRNPKHFSEIYLQASNVAKLIGVEPSMKRCARKQQHRANTPSSTIEEHYLVNLFYPFLDFVTQQLTDRFPKESKGLYSATKLMPATLIDLSPDQLSFLVRELEWFRNDLSHESVLRHDIERWQMKWKSNKNLPYNIQDVYRRCDKNFFPNIHSILTVFMTVPVSSCCCERSFSALRRLKTWLRSTTGQDRLTGLALLHVHRDKSISPLNILRRWDASGHRRIMLAFDSRL